MTRPSRRAATAAWALHTDVSLDDVNLHLAALEDAGLLGAVEEDGKATVYLPAPVELALAGRWEPVGDRDWNEAWKAGLEPVTVGAVTIIPPWRPPPEASGAVLVIEPAQAFGTGHHETTTGCLAALQELDLAGRRVLDVGTGTGVLALAAVRLGAGTVVAVDTDPLAVTAARGNAARNSLPLDVRVGSVEAAGSAPYDVVVANLDTATLTRVAVQLAAALAADGTLVVSGVGVERQAQALAALQGAGLAVAARPGREWTVLVAARRR